MTESGTDSSGLIRLRLQYDGSCFAGSQRQKNSTAVQNAVESMLSDIYAVPVTVITAGRTDSGVHAGETFFCFPDPCGKANPVARRIPVAKLVMLLNKKKYKGLTFLDALVVPNSFHPRYSARVRLYRYRLKNRYGMHPVIKSSELANVHYPGFFLDTVKMNVMLSHLTGAHDFSSFASVHDNSPHKRREIFLTAVYESRSIITVEIYGNAFLRGMVRSIIGNMLFGLRSGEDTGYLKRLLDKKDPLCAPQRAPGMGLSLDKIFYSPVFGMRDYYSYR